MEHRSENKQNENLAEKHGLNGEKEISKKFSFMFPERGFL